MYWRAGLSLSHYDAKAHLVVARRLVEAHPEIGALVLECTNMPPYRADIQAATGLPVFDITTLVRMVHEAVRHGLAPRPA